MKGFLTFCALVLVVSSEAAYCEGFHRDALVRKELAEVWAGEKDSLGSPEYRRKDPIAAFAIAAGPGFFVHGAGHFYIGEKKVGAGLLAAELVSLPLFYISIAHGWAESEGGSTISSNLAFAIGSSAAILFFGSYFVDVAVAPAKAAEMNRKHAHPYIIYPKVEKHRISVNLTLTL